MIRAISFTILALIPSVSMAKDCAPTLKPGNGYKGILEMPPPKYWVKPGRDYKTVSCETMTALYHDASNRDCHLLGTYVAPTNDPISVVMLMSFGLEPGDVTVCSGIKGVTKTMVLIHEYAHRRGWKHGQNSKWYSVKAWIADPNVPAWAKE